MTEQKKTLKSAVKNKSASDIQVDEIGIIQSLSAGTAEINGLPFAQMNEVLTFKNNIKGMVQKLNKNSVGVVFLSNPEELMAGDKAYRTEQVLSVPVGDALLGRVINPLGEPLDGLDFPLTRASYPIERPATPIMHRAPVNTPLQTGIKAIDSFIPIGRGQRELILGDRQTGKTAIAVDTIINQKETDVICIYCAIGQRATATARVINDLTSAGVMHKTVIIVAGGDSPAGLQYVAPYAATSIGEYFMEQGKDVLIIYDDLTAHARAYRQLSLLLRTPPGREAFPGDIFYIHARLLERSTHLREQFGGGSLTALPIVSTEAGNISAYIPTNIISITDGQIYLSAESFQKGMLPAIDTGRSVSRVGGDAQLPAYRSLVGPLKLFYAQFEELESFARFSTQLDTESSRRLKRGEAIRAVLLQGLFHPMPAIHQIAVFTATNAGLLDDIPIDKINEAQEIIIRTFQAKYRVLAQKIVEKKYKPTENETAEMIKTFQKALSVLKIGG
ncbi:MAG: F0F1 ATP synthase subunit alpha [Alphaproteobacteria bacterium]|nr:F0F1 ATP synthase subunit alpha [Alphaproteobacteria bacterium]